MTGMVLEVGTLTLETLSELRYKTILLPHEAENQIQASHQFVEEVVQSGKTIYGVNTGFGKLANQRIAQKDLSTLQHNLILSHAVGVGEALPNEIVALILLLKINSLALGFSGVSLNLVNRLISLFNQKIYPKVPAKGSVGASGDLAPLAHLSCTLLGIGDCWYQGQWQSASVVLKQLDYEPLQLGPKEGLALINGTQVSTAIAVDALIKARCLFETALIAGSLTLDATMGSDVPFVADIHRIRRQSGQQKVAACLLQLMSESEIRRSHVDQCDKIQDPYSLRCQPQVMGAILDQMQYCAQILENECNAVTDNPLIFPKEKRVLSGGNFHAEYVAFAADAIAIAISEVSALSERRIALLMDNHMSGLPAFLVREPGLNSGLMIAQVTAAALASENKSLCFPNSVDSLPTSANQEDHVSMATHAAWRLHRMIDNLASILAIELIAACQGIDFRAPFKTAALLIKVHQAVRQRVAFIHKDRWLAPDIENIKTGVLEGAFALKNEKHLNSETLWKK